MRIREETTSHALNFYPQNKPKNTIPIFLDARPPKFLRPFLLCQLLLPHAKYWNCSDSKVFPCGLFQRHPSRPTSSTFYWALVELLGTWKFNVCGVLTINNSQVTKSVNANTIDVIPTPTGQMFTNRIVGVVTVGVALSTCGKVEEVMGVFEIVIWNPNTFLICHLKPFWFKKFDFEHYGFCDLCFDQKSKILFLLIRLPFPLFLLLLNSD